MLRDARDAGFNIDEVLGLGSFTEDDLSSVFNEREFELRALMRIGRRERERVENHRAKMKKVTRALDDIAKLRQRIRKGEGLKEKHLRRIEEWRAKLVNASSRDSAGHDDFIQGPVPRGFRMTSYRDDDDDAESTVSAQDEESGRAALALTEKTLKQKLAAYEEDERRLLKKEEKGYSVESAIAAGYELEEMRVAGFTSAEVAANFSLQDRRKAGYTLKESREVVSLQVCLKHGYHGDEEVCDRLRELRDAGGGGDPRKGCAGWFRHARTRLLLFQILATAAIVTGAALYAAYAYAGFGERLTTGAIAAPAFRPIVHWFVIGGLVMLAVTIYSLYRLVKELQYRKRVKEGLEPRRHSGDARHSGSADSFTRRQSVELGVV